jgi:predicted Zn-ribbon and HTH transcriptional regulator
MNSSLLVGIVTVEYWGNKKFDFYPFIGDISSEVQVTDGANKKTKRQGALSRISFKSYTKADVVLVAPSTLQMCSLLSMPKTPPKCPCINNTIAMPRFQVKTSMMLLML